MEEEEYTRYRMTQERRVSREGYESDSSTEEFSVAKDPPYVQQNISNKEPPMVTIKIEDTDAIQQINQQNECVEKHELEIAEKESQINKKIADSNETNVIPIFENNSLKPITEDMQDQDLKETGAEGYKHSMKNFFQQP